MRPRSNDDDDDDGDGPGAPPPPTTRGDSEASPLLRSRATNDADVDESITDADPDTPWPSASPQRIIMSLRFIVVADDDDAESAAFKRLLWTRVRYYIPIIGWLPHYSIAENLQGDVVAGITVACLLIPQGLSYAQALVNIPPVYGLYTCFVPLIVYAMLGTSRQLGVGPEALISILVGAAIKEKSGLNVPIGHAPPGDGETGPGGDIMVPGENMAENIGIATLMGLMVGLFTFMLGFFRLGFLDSVLSRALLRGFVTAVAVVVMIDLSGPLMGIPAISGSDHMSPVELLIKTMQSFEASHVPTTVISVISICFLIAMRVIKSRHSDKKWLQLVPEILVLVVLSTLICAVFRLDLYGVQILKDVKGGLIYPTLPPISVAKVRYYLLSAILISVIGFVESIVIAKTYATKRNYAISPNRELVAIGAANVVGSLFGGWPAFGSLGRSSVNDSSGARTQVAGFVTGIVVLVVIVALLPLFYFLPKAVCSSIIVVAASKLIELHDIEFLLRLRAWSDLGLLLMTFLTTIFISIEVGTLISVGTSLLLVVKHTTKSRIAILGRTHIIDPKTGQVKTKFRSITDSKQVEPIDGALVIKIEEGLFFGNTGQLKDRLKRVEMYGELGVHPGEAPRSRGGHGIVLQSPSGSGSGNNDGVHVEVSVSGEDRGSREVEGNIHSVIFDIGGVNDIDASATQTLVEIVESYHSRHILVCFIKLRANCKSWFDRSGLTDLIGSDHFFEKINDAIEHLREKDRIPIPPYAAPDLFAADVTSDGSDEASTSVDRRTRARRSMRREILTRRVGGGGGLSVEPGLISPGAGTPYGASVTNGGGAEDVVEIFSDSEAEEGSHRPSRGHDRQFVDDDESLASGGAW